MTFASPLPWWALTLAVAAAGAVAWHAYRGFDAHPGRRIALSGLRLLTLLLLIVFLMRPVATNPESGGPDGVVPILVDTSRSMSIQDAGGRRLDAARRLIESELVPALGGEFQLDVLAFGEGVAERQPEELAATGRRSDLAGALDEIRERYRGRAVPGVILLSDGGDTSGRAGAPGEPIGVPVYALAVGNAEGSPDREVTSITAAEAVLDNSRVELAVSAVSYQDAGRPFELRLLENGRAIEVRRVSPAADGVPVREVFQVAPATDGPTVYTVEIPVSPGEVVPENNVRSVLVSPPARTRRVLLIEGAPGYEHAFIKRALGQDSGLDIDAVVRHGRNERGQDTFYIQAAADRARALETGFPASREALFAYDTVILANVEGRQLGDARLDLLRAFVAERGGGLLALGARSFLNQGLLGTPIEDALPLDLSGRSTAVLPASAAAGLNKVALTEHGLSHPIMQLGARASETREIWEAMPPLSAIAPLGGPRAGASVLAVTGGPGGAPRALVAVQRFGEGRSMAFTGEATWRWRMLRPSSDRGFETFWRQAVRWLALRATDPMAIQPPVTMLPGEPGTLAALVRTATFAPVSDADVEFRVTAPDGRIEAVRAGNSAGDDGRYVARFQPEQPGVYRVTATVERDGKRLGTASTALLAGGFDPEMTDPRVNTALLERVAYASGGRLIAAGDAASLAGELRAALPEAQRAVRRDLWHTGWSFLAIVALLVAEWGLRRRWGLR